MPKRSRTSTAAMVLTVGLVILGVAGLVRYLQMEDARTVVGQALGTAEPFARLNYEQATPDTGLRPKAAASTTKHRWIAIDTQASDSWCTENCNEDPSNPVCQGTDSWCLPESSALWFWKMHSGRCRCPNVEDGCQRVRLEVATLDSQQECAELCQATANCGAFDWNNSGSCQTLRTGPQGAIYSQPESASNVDGEGCYFLHPQ